MSGSEFQILAAAATRQTRLWKNTGLTHHWLGELERKRVFVNCASGCDIETTHVAANYTTDSLLFNGKCGEVDASANCREEAFFPRLPEIVQQRRLTYTHMYTYCEVMRIWYNRSGGSSIFKGGDFGNRTRTAGILAYGRILCIHELGRE